MTAEERRTAQLAGLLEEYLEAAPTLWDEWRLTPADYAAKAARAQRISEWMRRVKAGEDLADILRTEKARLHASEGGHSPSAAP